MNMFAWLIVALFFAAAIFTVFALLLFLFLLFLLALMPRRRRPETAEFAKALYAHRGLWDESAAENSLSAFSVAVEKGFGIELDVQLSSDGEVMVFHDEDLARMTGVSGSLYEKDKAFLSSLRLAGTADAVPTLKEVLALVDGRVPLLIEIKSDHAWREVCEKTAALLDDYHGAYLIESFHPLAVAWFRKNRPHVVRGQLSARIWKDKTMRTLSHAVVQNLLLNFYARPDFIAYDLHDKNYFAFRLTRLFGPVTFAWTVRTPEDLAACADFDSLIFEGEAAALLYDRERNA